ncbi:MAG: hypothetical protein EOP48_11620, partial [Sphingobacteriales bacterium]
MIANLTFKNAPEKIFLKRSSRRWLIIVSLQLILLPILAQQPYSLVHYDENDLPQTSIGNIQQDETGFLWMNSQFGIVRFDGEKFKAFTTSNVPGLHSNRIRLCVKGPDKSIWFLDENNTVIKIRSNNQFQVVTEKEAIKTWGLGFYVTEGNNDISYLKPGKMSNEKLISILNYDKTKEALKSFTTGINQGYIFYLNPQQQTQILYYDNDQYLVSTPPKLFSAKHSFKIDNQVASQVSASEALLFNKNKAPRKVQVTGLSERFNEVFKQEGLILFSHESGTFFYAEGKLYEYKIQDSSVEATLIFEDLPCTGVVNVMKERTTGDYFISTRSEGIYRVKKKRFSVITMVPPAVKTPGSNADDNNIIYSINFTDSQHLLANGYATFTTASTNSSTLFFPVDKSAVNRFFS